MIGGPPGGRTILRAVDRESEVTERREPKIADPCCTDGERLSARLQSSRRLHRERERGFPGLGTQQDVLALIVNPAPRSQWIELSIDENWFAVIDKLVRRTAGARQRSFVEK